MKIFSNTFTRFATLVAAILLLSACATSQKAPDGPIDARVALTALQSNPLLATRAPVEMRDAEAAVKAAEMTARDSAHYSHRMLMADQKVEIARARAQSRQYEDQRKALSEQSERARLDARTLEADRARRDAQFAREDADSARTSADSARSAAETARADAARARDEATASQAEVAASRAEVAASRAERLELERQIAELNARETDRGLVVTLGDLLFATGRSDLMGAAAPNLNKLAAFLDEYKDRTVLIEGHTDSVGSRESNQLLSQRRAESVRSYLVDRGVAANRLTTSGLGQGSPVASNDTATGRQQNRRVEVIISNTARVSSVN
jgi:outer membrane protein OmpA-like peptidoglycan-associated protein